MRRKREAKAQAGKRQSESIQEAEVRRKREAEAQERRRQDNQAKKRYIVHLCIYLIPLVIIFCFKSRKRDLETEQAKGKRMQQETTAKEQQ